MAIRDELVELIRGAGIAGDVARVEGGAPFREAGVDSLDMANILLLIEEKYGLKISDEEARTLRTVEAIATFLAAKGKGQAL